MIHVQLSSSCERATEEGDGSGQSAPMIPSFSKLSRHLEAPKGFEMRVEEEVEEGEETGEKKRKGERREKKGERREKKRERRGEDRGEKRRRKRREE